MIPINFLMDKQSDNICVRYCFLFSSDTLIFNKLKLTSSPVWLSTNKKRIPLIVLLTNTLNNVVWSVVSSLGYNFGSLFCASATSEWAVQLQRWKNKEKKKEKEQNSDRGGSYFRCRNRSQSENCKHLMSVFGSWIDRNFT